MTRWLLRPLALAALLCCLCALPALGQSAIDPSDDFDDGVLDFSKWFSYTWPEGTGSIEERDGVLIMTRAAGDWSHTDLSSTWTLRGAFDVQVDYQLLDWPQAPYLGVMLFARTSGDYSSVCRYQNTGWEGYVASYLGASQCICGGIAGTADMSGSLRLVRDADDNLTGYYWSADSGSWVALGSAVVPGDTTIALWFDAADQPATVAFDDFRVNSGEVVPMVLAVEDVQIDRGRDTDWWDWARYHQRVTVRVKGHQHEQPACLIIDDPDGSQYVISTCSPVGWYDWMGANPGFPIPQLTVGPDYTYTYTWYEARKPQPLLPGSYQITVIGNNGSQPTLTTAAAPAVPEAGPVLTEPAVDGVVDTTVPTFAWLSPAGSESWLQLRAEGGTNYTGPVADDEAEIWRAYVGEETTAEYNFDGSGPDLDPGRTYFWQVNSWTPVDDRVSDPLVSIWSEQTARHRFTIDAVWPPLPDLPGRLAHTQIGYGNWSRGYEAVAIAQYGPTVGACSWIGPAASEFPDFSWDGSALQYHISDAGTWIDTLDGAAPTRVPNLGPWAFYSSFSPDATSIVYCEPTDPDWVRDVWAQRLDGSDKRLLVPARGRETRYPHWSPDGAWIAYASCCDPSGHNIWLIRPDGTQDHPVVPTTVAGYPGWEAVWLGTASLWSPDATRLLTNFTAVSPDGSEFFNAVGTISRDGGEVTPVWINPPEYYCCAAAFPNAWSPDGQSVVFSSGHHLAPDPEWLDAKFEPGVELWLAPADGLGPPLRLTYDYSYANGSSWWAPNTPVGKEVSVMKGEAMLTFTQVMAEGSTRMNVTSDVPGAAPEGYAFASDLWSGATTAGYHGDITVALPYDAGLAGQEGALALMEWNPEKEKWQDITARPIDVMSRTIRGQTKDLGVFAVCVRTR